MVKQKYYVVWVGRNKGIFNTWNECASQVNGYIGAKYMAFENLSQAEIALKGDPSSFFKKNTATINKINSQTTSESKPVSPSICVDAACSGVPGPVEWRGVNIINGKELFKAGPYQQGTNNIGEFLAIVQGLKWLTANNFEWVLYSDSMNAISWVKQKKCKTKQGKNHYNRELFKLIVESEQWLQDNPIHPAVLKWLTDKWGENPADFGRK